MTETNGSEVESPLAIEHARELLQQHVARLNAEQYRIGRIFNEVVDKRLAGVGTYKSAVEHLGPAVKALSEKDVRRAQAAARRFSEAVFVKYGVRRLSTLVQYGKRLKQEWGGGEPDHMLLRVPGEDGYLKEKPFPECTPEEVGRAISSELPKESVPLPRLDEYCIHLLREGIRKRFSEDSSASVKAVVREGKVHVTLRDVSVTELKMLAQAILDSVEPLERETHRRTLTPHFPLSMRAIPSLGFIRKPSAAVTERRAP